MRERGETAPVFPLGSAAPLQADAELPRTGKARIDPERLDRPVTDLKGVGRRTAERLGALGIRTIGDLLHHVPFRHEEPARLTPIRMLREGEEATIRGRVQSSALRRTRRARLTVLEALIGDDSGTVRAVWYNQAYLQEPFAERPEVLLRGRLIRGRGDLHLRVRSHEILSGGGEPDGLHTLGLVPIYPAGGDVSVRLIRTLLARAMPEALHLVDPVPARILAARGYPAKADALATVHFPTTLEEARSARDRLAFEELLLLQTALLRSRLDEDARLEAVEIGPPGDLSRAFLASLPYEPTGAQRRVIAEIDADLSEEHPMRRLLQGDVGSGKTLVATYALLRAVESGGQAALMAPTEVLADQHAARLREQLAGLPVELVLLKGSQPAAERRESLRRVAAGEVGLVIGTHALIQQGVSFADLRVAVVDEQHRFGVEQREALVSVPEGGRAPHVLHMTATPIPRTLSLTLYGDLDVSVIDELPPGRTPVVTRLVREEHRDKLWGLVRRELDEGRQAYVVCPLVEESDVLCAASATKTYEALAHGELRGYRSGLLHGQLPAGDKQAVMHRFVTGELQALVSTTVIEVGVDVPNASVMVIEGARRFGLSQLHQLRGRVGRGAAASYCLLLLDPAGDEESLERLALFARTSDGFALAEADLALRGEGQLFGQRQSGAGDLRVARLLTDGRLLEEARATARDVLSGDPDLTDPRHRLLGEAAAERFGARTGWLDRV